MELSHAGLFVAGAVVERVAGADIDPGEFADERARACRAIASLFVNGQTRWALDLATKFLDPLLRLAEKTR